MEDVLPVLCNCDHLAMQAIHAALIREGTCVTSDCCDYCIVGDKNPIAAEYTANAFRRLLVDLRVRQSFSRPGTPHDNAVSEAFFSILKKEELYRRDYRSERDFRQSVDKFIRDYNTERPHRFNNYQPPVTAEAAYWRTHLDMSK